MEAPADGLEMDAISTSTPIATNQHISYDAKEKEYVMKFLFRLKTNKNTEVAMTQYAILQAINLLYPEVLIFNSYGSTMKFFDKVVNYNAYLCNFKLQLVKGNKAKHRPPIYVAFHCFCSKIPISEIRRHVDIHRLLEEVNTRMTVHHWSEDEVRISTLGFFVGFDPGNILEEEVVERVRAKIVQQTCRPIHKIPKFKCIYTSPFILDHDNHRCSTKAYGLQCRQADAKELISLLKDAYQHSPTFIFHKVCHDNPQIYYRAILKQNNFLSKSQIVPIQGISTELMFYVSNHIQQVPGVKDCTRHKSTYSSGRWNVHTTTEHFSMVTKTLQSNLAQWALSYTSQENVDLCDLPPPNVVFKTTPFEPSTPGASYDTYISACSSLYAMEEVESDSAPFHQPPYGSSPVTQAWRSPLPVPTIVETCTVATTQSPISLDQFERMRQENERLIQKNTTPSISQP